MSDAVEFKFTGGPELHARLSALSEKVERKLGRQALRAGAQVLRRRIIATLPVDLKTPDGVHLNASVRIGGSVKELRRGIGLRVAYSGMARTYGHIIEFGGVRQSPNPIWRTAVHAVGQQVVDKIIAKLAKDLDREAARAAAGKGA